jgi:hypothetical protein
LARERRDAGVKNGCADGHVLMRGWCPCAVDLAFVFMDHNKAVADAALSGDKKRLAEAVARLREYRSYKKLLGRYNEWIRTKHPERWAVGMAD